MLSMTDNTDINGIFQDLINLLRIELLSRMHETVATGPWSKIALIAWLFGVFVNIPIVISCFYAILPRL